MSAREITEREAAWLETLRDGHGPQGTVDPHSVRELVRLAQRLRVVTDAEQAERDRVWDESVVRELEQLAAFYRTPRAERDGDRAKELAYTVRRLLREFINGWGG